MLLRGQVEPGKPDVKKCIVVTPTSLVGNWSQELEKWVPNRVEHIALSDSSKEKVSATTVMFCLLLKVSNKRFMYA